MKKYWQIFKNNLPLVVIVVLAFSLRFINLGYSDYQGDEIKAFFRPDEGQTAVEFLLDQRKGPGQFFVTLLVNQVDADFSNQLLFRFPFALAGSLAVFFFYKLIREHFGKKIAFYSSFFFATNGFFVALSRIVQYQAFVILFSILTLFMFTLAIKRSDYKAKGIFWGFLFWSLALLFHYDAVLIAPFALFLLIIWFRDNVKELSIRDESIMLLIKVLALNAVVLSVFYVPFVYNISKSTLQYWSGRISGSAGGKISSSKYLFIVYQPIYVVHFYIALFALGLFSFGYNFFSWLFKKVTKLKKLWQFIPNQNFDKPAMFAVFLWLGFAVAFLEGYVHIPGTHIYTYLLPMTVVMALGIVFMEDVLKKFRRYFIPEVISFVGLFFLFAFIFLQSYAIFVDNTQEYPWESEDFFIWTFHQPTPTYHLSMFGFPYYRNWEGIGNIVTTSDNNGHYSTNERRSIARFFIPFDKSTDAAGHYVHIINPQSFTNEIRQDKARYWAERYPPIFTFSRSGKDLVRVYYMEPGTLEEIKMKGY